jgi:hypothetical protein
MSEQVPARPVTLAQMVGIMVATLALFFLVAFATKAMEAYRLRVWRDYLQSELDDMRWQRAEVQEELRRRQSPSYVEETLHQAGQVSAGSVSVVPVVVLAEPVATVVPTRVANRAAVPVVVSTPPPASLFRNPYWEAWQRLIWGFD